MKHTILLFTLAAIPAFAYDGPFQEIPVWRGEETIVRLNGNLEQEFDSLVTNDEVKTSILATLPVPYTDRNSQVAFRQDLLTDFNDGCSYESGMMDGSRYLRISTPENAKPGIHDLGPVHIRVIDRVLPKPADWKYLLDLWQHPWAVSRINGVKPFSRDHYALMEPLWKTLAWCGVKPITATLIDQPWNHQCYDAYHSMIRHVRNDDGSWTHDYRLFDEYIAFARQCGLGPRIDCYTMCPWGYIVRWENAKGEAQRGEAKPGSDLFKEFWGNFLPDFSKHLEAKGWLKDTFIAMDERAPDDMKIISEFVREKSPKLRIHTAGNRNPAEFKDITIESFCLGLDHFNEGFIKEINARKAQGLTTTFYVCCGPARPNTFMSSNNDEAFWLGFFPATRNLDGFLRWAANSWPRDPENNASFGDWEAGDTFLIYPRGNLSLRLAYLRAGIVAAEKWRILGEKKLFEKERAELAAKWGDYKQALDGKAELWRCRLDVLKLVNRD